MWAIWLWIIWLNKFCGCNVQKRTYCFFTPVVAMLYTCKQSCSMIGFYSLVLLDFSSRNKQQNVLLKEQLYTVAVYCLSVVNREALFKPTKATKNASDPNRSLSLFRLCLKCSSLYWIKWTGKWSFQISLQFYIWTGKSLKAYYCVWEEVCCVGPIPDIYFMY